MALGERGHDLAQKAWWRRSRAARRWPRASRARRECRSRAAGAGRRSDAKTGREVAEPGALGGRLGVGAVHRLHVHERRMALVAPRGPHRAADLVAGAQLAAADLGGRDVHVVARVLPRGRSAGRRCRWEDVEHAGDDLLLGHRLLDDLGLLLHRRRRVLDVEVLLLVGSSSSYLGLDVLVIRRARAPRPRGPRRARARRRRPPRPRRSPPWPRRMASTRSALRMPRKPSTPSSDAIAWRSASGLVLEFLALENGHDG